MSSLLCGCGHPKSDHSWGGTGACMVRVSDKYDCACISAVREPSEEADDA